MRRHQCHLAACGLAVDAVPRLSLPAERGVRWLLTPVRSLLTPVHMCGLLDRMRSVLGVLGLAVCVFVTCAPPGVLRPMPLRVWRDGQPNFLCIYVLHIDTARHGRCTCRVLGAHAMTSRAVSHSRGRHGASWCVYASTWWCFKAIAIASCSAA